MRNKNLLALVESAIMIALSFVLNLVVLWQAPLGGKLTLVSMLPVMLIGIKHGVKWGFITTAVYGVLQLFLSLGAVLSWGLTPTVLVIALLFDYLVPYTVLGVASLFRKCKTPMLVVGICISLALRFLCHFTTGITIWANWFEDSPWSIISYSAVYNGQYMLPEIVLTAIASYVLLSLPQMKKLLGTK